MTPTNPVAPIETISNSQIGRASDRFSERCRKNAGSLPKDATQEVLEEEGDALAQEMFEALRRRVERRSKVIVRRVTFNRDGDGRYVICFRSVNDWFDHWWFAGRRKSSVA